MTVYHFPYISRPSHPALLPPLPLGFSRPQILAIQSSMMISLRQCRRHGTNLSLFTPRTHCLRILGATSTTTFSLRRHFPLLHLHRPYGVYSLSSVPMNPAYPAYSRPRIPIHRSTRIPSTGMSFQLRLICHTNTLLLVTTKIALTVDSMPLYFPRRTSHCFRTILSTRCRALKTTKTPSKNFLPLPTLFDCCHRLRNMHQPLRNSRHRCPHRTVIPRAKRMWMLDSLKSYLCAWIIG